MPTVPGSDGLIQSEEDALAVAREVPCTASVSSAGLRLLQDIARPTDSCICLFVGPACVWTTCLPACMIGPHCLHADA